MSSPFQLRVEFPHGRYHATALTSTTNSGHVEWPPSPWRLLRALLAAWHLNRPEVDESRIERVVAAFRTVPKYRLPDSTRSTTAHYLPAHDHKQFHKVSTDMTFDTRLSVSPDDPLLIRWEDVDLPQEDRALAAELWESLSYLGRADSRCVIQVDHEFTELDDTWTIAVPEESFPVGSVEVLCLQPTTTLSQLNIGSASTMRKDKRGIPVGTRLVAYIVPNPPADPIVQMPRVSAPRQFVNAVVWRISTKSPVAHERGLRVTERLRQHVLKSVFQGDSANVLVHGHDVVEELGEVASQHPGAHWLWRADPHTRAVTHVGMWIPGTAEGDPAASLTPTEIAGLSSVYAEPRAPQCMRGNQTRSAFTFHPPLRRYPKKFEERAREEGTEPLSDPTEPNDMWRLPEMQATLVAMGEASTILEPWFGTQTPTSVWVSETPYLAERHRKRGRDDDLTEFLRKELQHQVSTRGLGNVVDVEPLDWDGAAKAEFVTWRIKGKRTPRELHSLRLTLDRPHSGPLVLGHLAHFGFGVFRAAE